VSHLRPMRGEIGNTLIECPVVPCDQAFLDVQKFIDHCEKVHRPEFERHQNLNKAQPKYPDSPSPDPTWHPDPDTIKVTAIEGADGRYGAVASADPDKAKRHAMALYVETHDSSLQKAECSCGWKTDWTSNDRRDRLIRRHLENRTLQKQED